MGYTGDGKDRNIWTGILAATDKVPKQADDLTSKEYVDSVAGVFDANIIVVLDGAVATLDGNVLILQ